MIAAVLCTHASATLHCHLAAAAGVTQGLQALQQLSLLAGTGHCPGHKQAQLL